MSKDIKSPVQRDYTKERDDVCKPIAVEILRVIANEGEKLVIGSTVKESDIVDYYSALYEKIIAVFITRADVLRVVDIDYVFRIAQQSIQLMQDRMRITIEDRHNSATAKLYNVKDVDDITLAKLHEVLSNEDKTENNTRQNKK